MESQIKTFVHPDLKTPGYLYSMSYGSQTVLIYGGAEGEPISVKGLERSRTHLDDDGRTASTFLTIADGSERDAIIGLLRKRGLTEPVEFE